MMAAMDTQAAVLSRPSVDGDSVPFMQVLACAGGGYECVSRRFGEGFKEKEKGCKRPGRQGVRSLLSGVVRDVVVWDAWYGVS